MTHCYGMVGVARDLAPSTGSGAELYTVIGHAPRPLDRNIALVGRVIDGMQWLSSLPRGTGNLGVYQTEAERTPILSVRLASQLPEDERPHFQYRATDNVRFAAWLKGRENREGPFFTVPAGGVDICNAQVPIRRTPAE
jgi:peptidylprolyl isomerase